MDEEAKLDNSFFMRLKSALIRLAVNCVLITRNKNKYKY